MSASSTSARNASIHAENRGPVTFVISFRVKPDCVEEFNDKLAHVLDAMRHEDTFINAILHRDPKDATRFMLYETWADFDDVANVQIHRDYRQDYWARLPELLVETQDIQTWHPVRSDARNDNRRLISRLTAL